MASLNEDWRTTWEEAMVFKLSRSNDPEFLSYTESQYWDFLDSNIKNRSATRHSSQVIQKEELAHEEIGMLGERGNSGNLSWEMHGSGNWMGHYFLSHHE